jgi:two-component system cell cycle sensor histidine kinase/response regulator CckA
VPAVSGRYLLRSQPQMSFLANGPATDRPPHEPGERDARPLARLKPLLDVASLGRGERELDELLDALAETIATGLGWGTVVVNIYRAAWDDFQVTTVHGSESARRALLATTAEWAQWQPLLEERFYRCGAYLVDHESMDWESTDLKHHIPERENDSAPGAWDVRDALVVPLAHSEGHLLGIISVDEPASGKKPTDEELDLLAAVAAQAARAIEHSQRQSETRRAQAALEHLHEVSARLTAPVSPKAVLDAVAHGIARSLGFEKVCVLLRDGKEFSPVSLCGWDPKDPSVNIRVSLADIEQLFEPRFEVEGCYLLSYDEASKRSAAGADYASRMNGRGPRAWNRHWLLAPLHDDRGELSGLIWADDPDDRLLPSNERLKVLRMFANHASTALELARTFTAEHEANELWRASINASPLVTFTLDLDAVIRSWNPAAERLYGWTADEVVGKPFPLTSPEGRLEFEHLLRAVLDGRSFSGLEIVREARNGSRLEISASAAPLRNAQGEVTGAIILHEDITKRKSAERALERRHRELSALHRTTYDLLETLDEDGVLTTIVASACDLLRADHAYVYLLDPEADELVSRYGTGDFAQFVGTKLQRGEGLGGTVWKTGETVSVGEYEDWDGHSPQFADHGFRAVAGVPLRSRHGFIGVLGIGHADERTFSRDDLDLLEQFGRLASLAFENARLYSDAQREIEERRQAEAELRQSKELHTRVLETSTDSITLYELDGTIAFASRSNETMLGWSQEELVGRNYTEFIHPDDLAESNAVIGRSLLTGESMSYCARVLHKDGHWVVLEGKPATIRDEHGNPELILALARDVSERRNSEERRRELEAQLRQSQKMDAIGRLAGGIAHDFNNLLTAMAGYGGLALGAVEEHQKALRADIQEMLTAAERARQLIRQLLAFGRKQVLQPCILDLNSVVGDMESILRRLIGEDVELVTTLDPELGHTNADPGQLEQVVMNFAINARDAMAGGGRLSIETLNTELDAEFVATHVGATAGPAVALRVTDNGAGMDASVRSRVFEPFFTTKEEAKGTGLGLSTVYGIVKQSGGYIWCESEPGEGTTFTVYLPRFDTEPDAEVDAADDEEPLDSLMGVETVLIAEDEQVVRHLVVELLGRLGYSVIAAANGAEALELIDTHAGDIDLLLTDVVMPGMSGRDLAAVVRERCPETRVLFMSGYAEDAVVNHGVLQPGTALLEKPFTAVSLGTIVRAVLDN